MFAKGKKQYFVFPWANGGNLSNLWKKHDGYYGSYGRSDIAYRLIPAIVKQLVGLAHALKELHTFSHGSAASYRHGDLKPENILVFDYEERGFPGVWKMADLGLARYHYKATGDRKYVTSNSGAGTISYQPPESIYAKASATSRLYDIWSMGCILLQMMTWLLYGTRKLSELTTNTTPAAFARDQSSYWTATYHGGKYHNIRIHPAVQDHMRQMKRDVQGSKALQALLSVIEDKLLVVKRPPNTTVPWAKGFRTNAADLHQSLREIQVECKNPGYCVSGRGIAQQASFLQVPQGQTLGVEKRNKVSSNSSISSIQYDSLLSMHVYPFRQPRPT